MKTRRDGVDTTIPFFFLTRGSVDHLHTISVMKELAAGFLASAGVLKGFCVCRPVRAPVHQHLSRDHVERLGSERYHQKHQRLSVRGAVCRLFHQLQTGALNTAEAHQD